MNELDQIRRRIRKFRDARDWMQFHSPKNLACSISIEANELLEHFQWSTPKESLAIARKKKTEISHEIADVAVYLIELADNLVLTWLRQLRRRWRIMRPNTRRTRCGEVPRNTPNTRLLSDCVNNILPKVQPLHILPLVGPPQ
jgi:NTP pyrophosphatase (non-canonical NTP hydrolase)